MASRTLLCALALLFLLPASAGASTPPTWKAVSVNGDATCAIGADDLLQCWGDASDEGRYPPADLGPVKAVALGWIHGCAIKSDDQVACWGWRAADLPSDLGAVKAINGDLTHTCAIKIDDTLACWGGYGGQDPIPSDLGPVKAVDAGHENTCAIRADDSLECWGQYEMGAPVSVPPDLGPVTSVSTSEFATCVVKRDDQSVACWGDPGSGVDLTVPATLGPVLSVTTANGTFCALKADHTVACWSGPPAAAPGDLTSVDSLSAGGTHACALRHDATLSCWGANWFGATYIPGADDTPPEVTPYAWGSKSLDDWYTSDVGVGWSATDDASIVTSRDGCDDASVTSDTAGQTFTCTATSGGGTTTLSQTIKRDATPPSIVADRPQPNAAGWYGDSVTINWACSDEMSGPVADSESATVTTDGYGQHATGTCADKAGNESTDTQKDINIDRTPPTVSINGCPRVDVTVGDESDVYAIASDALSGLAVDPGGQVTLDTATTGAHTATVTATDQAGNTARAECDYTVVAAKPKQTLLLAAPGPARADTQNNRGAFTLKWTPPKTTLGLALTYRLERRNAAGGDWSTVASGLAKATYAFAKTAPEEEGTWVYRVQVDNANVLSFPSEDGPPVTVDRTVPATPTLSVDPASVPAYTSPAGVPWFSGDVGLLLAAGDPADPALPDGSAGTGLKPFTAAWTRTTTGLGTLSQTVSDRAGNLSAPAKLTLGIDKAAPKVTATCPAQPVARRALAYATYAANDPDSGLVETPTGRVRLDTTQPGSHTATVTVHDHVGHATTVTCDYTVA